jgi:Tol biopolymer transport system component
MKILIVFALTVLFPGSQEYGQKPPGDTPVLFSPSFMRTGHRIHSSPAFSPDGDEVYWSVFPRTLQIRHKKETILCSQKLNNTWSSPKVASFSGEHTDGGPFFSFDGKRLYFYSKRPLDKETKSETGGEIWYVAKQGENWGEPQHIKLDVEGEKLFFSLISNNNIYFTSGHGFGGTGVGSVDIYRAKFINGKYAKPERLPNIINSRKVVESDPLIAPDEKCLIFYSLEKPGNIGQYDLYMSCKDGEDLWTKPVNLGKKINRGYSRFTRFSPDGRYLFFTRPDGVYWVDNKDVFFELDPPYQLIDITAQK